MRKKREPSLLKEGRRSSKTLIILIISFTSIAFVSLFITFAVHTVLKNKRSSQFEFELNSIDRIISTGRLHDAALQFKKLEFDINNSSLGIRYIQRSWKISNGIRDFSLMEDASEKVWGKFPEYQDITAFYVFALLKQHKNSKAFKIANNHLFSDKFSSLKAEAWLKASDNKNRSSGFQTDQILSEEDRNLLLINGFSKEETDLLIPFYKSALKSSSDIRLIKNLVLLYCARGDFDSAWNLAVGRIKNQAPELYLQISYDSRHYEEAFSVVNRLEQRASGEKRADLLMIKADLLIERGDYLSAFKICQQMIKNYSQFSVVPWRNLYPLAQKFTKEERVRYSLTSKDLEHYYSQLFNNKEPFSDLFTKEVELVLIYAQVLRENAEIEKVSQLLSGYIQNDFSNPELELMYHIVTDSSQINNHISQIQILMSKDQDNELLPQYLAHYLSAFPDRKMERDDLMRRAKAVFHDRQWLDFYNAYYHLMQGSYPSSFEVAAKQFEKLILQEKRWEYSYNAAVIYLHLANLDRAEYFADLSQTLVEKDYLLTDSPEDRKNLSQIKTVQGAIYERLQEWSDASNAYSSALSYDSGNIDAILALKKIKSENFN